MQLVREGKTGMFMAQALKIEKMLIADINCTIRYYLKNLHRHLSNIFSFSGFPSFKAARSPFLLLL